MHIILKKWQKLIQEIEDYEGEITSIWLFQKFLDWSIQWKVAKDISVKESYNSYLQYFEYFTARHLSEYPFLHDKEFIDDLVEYDLIRSKETNYKYDYIFSKISNLMWRLITIETSIECPNCKEGNYLLLTDKKLSNIYHSCDLCGNLQKLTQEREYLDNKKLYPISREQLNLLQEQGVPPRE